MHARIAGLAVVAATLFACGDPNRDIETGENPDAGTELGSAVGLGDVTAFDDDWDTSRDGRLDEREFDAVLASGTSDPGVNSYEGLDRDRFDRSAFRIWDNDDDRSLTEAEWEHGRSSWNLSHDLGQWSDWDANGDGSLSPDEYNSELYEHNIYDTLDADGSGILEPTEYGPAVFRTLDRNRDQLLDRDEWRDPRVLLGPSS